MLTVKGAARDKIRAGALELHVPVHYVDDVDAAQEVLDKRAGNHSAATTGAPPIGWPEPDVRDGLIMAPTMGPL
ncbi:hypothetical protein D3C83_183090 [compost metagenome]